MHPEESYVVLRMINQLSRISNFLVALNTIIDLVEDSIDLIDWAEMDEIFGKWFPFCYSLGKISKKLVRFMVKYELYSYEGIRTEWEQSLLYQQIFAETAIDLCFRCCSGLTCRKECEHL